MNILKFIYKNLLYFKKQNLAVLAGTILSTAVLTGALIIGDSVKGSLKQMVDWRLGKTQYALLTGDRFVRSQLAYELSDALQVEASPVLQSNGIAINTDADKRINIAQVYGVDSTFWNFSNQVGYSLLDNEALISINTAERLNLNKGDELLLRIENAEIIPLNAPFASQEKPSVSLRMTIKDILNEEQLGRFSIKSDQKAPYNIFVPRKVLDRKLELKGLCNLIVFSNKEDNPVSVETINKEITKLWQTEDISLEIKQLGNGKYELVSDRIFLEDQITEAANSLTVKKEKVLTYLINSINAKDSATPYSFVAAVEPPLVPENLKKDEIIINSWLADDVNVKTGDSINLAYYIIGPLRKLKEETKSFIIKEIIPLEDKQSLKALMPAFPGMSDAGHCREWETGVPIDLDKIRDKDEDYWNDYRGTPKAFISIEAGQNLWQSQFGKLSAIRFDSSEIESQKLKVELISKLNPSDFNLIVQPVYEQGIAATENAVDFGELFLSLSFFVIVAGVLLTILIHTLNTESRSAETGVLSGLGFNKKTILKIRIGESLIIAVFGGILGAFIGILYNYAMLAGLNTIWYDVVRTNMINVFVKPLTLLIGTVSGAFISLLSIYFVSRKKLKQPIAYLIKHKVTSAGLSKPKKSKAKIVAIISMLVTLGMLFYSFNLSIENSSGMFLGAGGVFIVAAIAFFSWYYDIKSFKGSDLNISALSIKNITRNKSRSLTTVILLALGTYVILITGANRQTFYGEENNNNSGTGGYLYWVETSLPVLENLNSAQGRQQLGIDSSDLPKEAHFMQFHNLEGNDASCLNLNQVQNPQILGVNATELNERQSFSFAKLLEGINMDDAWTSLNKKFGDDVIPAIADQSVLTWGLKKAVGDTLIYLNEAGKEIKMLIIGGLNNSIFQGNLLIADEFFNEQFPSVSGSKIMLVDANSKSQGKVAEFMNNHFMDYGIELNKATQRLAEFNSVTNTYLTVFMILGGLGVLIGTIGLGIVLLRNILERKQELALMTALGFTKKQLFNIVIRENLHLLFSGIIIGLLGAFIGILPSIFSPAFEIPGMFVFVILISVIISGVAWIYFPTKMSLKNVPIKAIRRE